MRENRPKLKLGRVRPPRVQITYDVEPLRKLIEVRKQLTALLAKTDGNDRLAEKLQEIIGNTELQQKIGKKRGLAKAKGSGKEGAY